MGIDGDILGPDGWHAALAALEWQIDLGVAEISGESPLDRYALPETTKTMPVVAKVEVAVVAAPQADPVQAARTAAQNTGTLAELRAALTEFDLCEVKRGF
jgi:uracil-DNA glycosylase